MLPAGAYFVWLRSQACTHTRPPSPHTHKHTHRTPPQQGQKVAKAVKTWKVNPKLYPCQLSSDTQALINEAVEAAVGAWGVRQVRGYVWGGRGEQGGLHAGGVVGVVGLVWFSFAGMRMCAFWRGAATYLTTAWRSPGPLPAPHSWSSQAHNP